MADQSASPRFHALFVSALQAYEKKTGVTLAQYPLAVQLQSCLSARDVTILLQSRAHAFSDCHATDKIMKSIKIIVSILALFSNAFTLTDAIGPVRQTVMGNALLVFHISDYFFKDIIPTRASNTG